MRLPCPRWGRAREGGDARATLIARSEPLMEKRTLFTNKWLGMALVVPQVLLIFTFFYWPAGQALYWAFTLERPWGGGNEWVGFGNFSQLLADPVYWNSILTSLIFAGSATVLAMGVALVMALLVDR